MLLRKIIIIIGFLLLTFNVDAQYFQFSQFNFTQQRINPAAVSASNQAYASLIYRQQKVSDGLNIKSTYFESSYPLFNKKGRWSGIGVSLLDDRAGYGGMFRTSEFGLSYALTVPLKKYSSLNLGFRGVYQNKRISFDGLTTGSQYIPGQGMVGGVNGEDIDKFRNNFFTFSSGVYWQRTDRYQNRLAYVGISLFDFNRPQDSFYSDNSRLSSTWMAQGGIQVYENNGLSILPEFLFTRSASKGMLIVGPVFTYDLYKSMRSNRPGKVNVITKYATGDYLIAGIQFEKEKFAVGFSYDIPVGNSVANHGTIEFGAQFKQLIKDHSKTKARKNKIKKKKKEKKKKLKKKKRAIKKKKKANKKKARDFKKSKKKVITRSTQTEKQTSERQERTNGDDTFIQAEQKEKVEETPAKEIAPRKVLAEEKPTKPEKSALETKAPQKPSSKSKYLSLELETAVLHFNFEFGQKNLNSSSKAYLREFVKVLNSDELLKIEIIGHTDDVGSEAFNQQLSLERAKVVEAFLMSEGIAPERIFVEGKGESEPLVENNSDENRSKNRRVDFKIGY